MNDSKTARDVIVDVLTARHEELSGEASPRDFDGASQILRALDGEGYNIVKLASPAEPDWDRVEDLAEAAMLADQTVISGYDFGSGFKAGYSAALVGAEGVAP